MKKYFTLFFILPFFGLAQNVQLHIHHDWMDLPFAMNSAGTTDDGEDFKFTLLKYYITGVTITHDGGQTTEITDFVDIADASTGIDVFDLGTPAVSQIEGIRFFIGVDSARNHDDPSLEPVDSPLSFQSPSMHWGWASGYRFILLEGMAGPSYNQTVQIHTLDDHNYHSTYIPLSAELVGGNQIIHVVGKYREAFRNINISSGLINHGATGEAEILANNFRDFVFHPYVLSLNEKEIDNVSIYPNPTNGNFTVANNGNFEKFIITDISGKIIHEVKNPSEKFELTIQNSGIYILTSYMEDGLISSQKIVVE